MIFAAEVLVLCALFTLLVVPACIKNPIAWIDDYPPAIRQRCRELGLIPAQQTKMSPATVARKVVFSLFAAGLLGCVLVYLNGAEGFWQGFGLSYALWLCVDWYDALVLDCLWVCHSKRVRIPGTEDMDKDYKNYGFHIKMSALGMVIGLPVCLLAGVTVWLLG